MKKFNFHKVLFYFLFLFLPDGKTPLNVKVMQKSKTISHIFCRMLFFGIQIQFKPLDPDSFKNSDPQRYYIVSDCMLSEVNKVTRIVIWKCTQMTPGTYLLRNRVWVPYCWTQYFYLVSYTYCTWLLSNTITMLWIHKYFFRTRIRKIRNPYLRMLILPRHFCGHWKTMLSDT